jgi:translation initiation factor IF-3
MHTDLGRQLLQRLAADVDDIAQVEQAPQMETRSMIMILSLKSS